MPRIPLAGASILLVDEDVLSAFRLRRTLVAAGARVIAGDVAQTLIYLEAAAPARRLGLPMAWQQVEPIRFRRLPQRCPATPAFSFRRLRRCADPADGGFSVAARKVPSRPPVADKTSQATSALAGDCGGIANSPLAGQGRIAAQFAA